MKKTTPTYIIIFLAAILLITLVGCGDETANETEFIEVWVEKATMPTGRYHFSTDVVDGKIYVIGGYDRVENSRNTVEIYDPSTDTWTEKSAQNQIRAGHVSCVANEKIYVFGGDEGNNWINHVEEYDPAADTWTEKAAVPLSDEEGAGLGSCATIDDKIYMLGGLFTPADNTEEEMLQMYDPATNTWTTRAPMPQRHYFATTSVANDKIYVIGGCASRQDYPCEQLLDTVHEYDPTSDTWQVKSPMPTARFASTSSTFEGSIYVLGGYINEGEGSTEVATVEKYDAATDTWTTVDPPLPGTQGKFGSAVVNNTLYIIGTDTYEYAP